MWFARRVIDEKPTPTPETLLGTEPGLGAGHTACAGCPAPSVVRAALDAARQACDCEPVVIHAAGCVELRTALYPRNAWRVPHLRAPAGELAAVASGLEAALRTRELRAELPPDRDIKILAFGQDDGESEVGLETLSAAMARGHDLTFVYTCHEPCRELLMGHPPESFKPPMNEEIPALPEPPSAMDTWRGTGYSPQNQEVNAFSQGHVLAGDLAAVMVASGVPYVAQASVSHYDDLLAKLIRAVAVRGPSLVSVLSPCPAGCGLAATGGVVSQAALAVACGLWPLYEIEDGRCKLSCTPESDLPMDQYVAAHPRFRRLNQTATEDLVNRLQQTVARQWTWLNASTA